ncbi:MAG: hypothetical protein SFY92_09975 [Verrucomicrobiae bacterium]|nr:hypothetical protein [Verrucomicrobiae bacterium]
MLRTLSLSMIFLALFSIGGGPRYTLQMVAWAGMLIDYSQKSGIVVAVAETFDGQHPCQMCKNIESAKKSDTSETLLKAEKKDKNLEQAAVVGLTHACSALIVVEMPRLLRAQFVSAPETGPPRMG